jgi:hypothetical protein
MKAFIFMLVLSFASLLCHGQSIVGRWQLVKQSNCVDSEVGANGEEADRLVEDMKGMSGAEPQVLQFRDNNTGEENTKIINKRKSYNSKAFLYRYNEGSLYILDKKSRTIIDGFTVEKLENDSLIISNVSRACDTKVFVRLK